MRWFFFDFFFNIIECWVMMRLAVAPALIFINPFLFLYCNEVLFLYNQTDILTPGWIMFSRWFLLRSVKSGHIDLCLVYELRLSLHVLESLTWIQRIFYYLLCQVTIVLRSLVLPSFLWFNRVLINNIFFLHFYNFYEIYIYLIII